MVGVTIPNQTTPYVGQQFSFSLPTNSFSDPDGDTLVYSASLDNGGTLPSWLTFNSVTEIFSGTPTVGSQGNYTIKVTAIDQKGGTVSQSFILTVPNRGITAKTIATQKVSVGSSFYYNLPITTFIDGDGDPLSYSASLQNGTALPSWLSFSSGAFSGTPISGMQGSYNTTIVVQDNHGESASSNFVLSVINAVPISTPIQDQTAKLGSVFSFVVPSL